MPEWSDGEQAMLEFRHQDGSKFTVLFFPLLLFGTLLPVVNEPLVVSYRIRETLMTRQLLDHFQRNSGSESFIQFLYGWFLVFHGYEAVVFSH